MLENRNQQQSSIEEGERRNSRSFAPDLSSGLKDLVTVDEFSVYLLSRVDIVIRFIEVDLMFGLPDYVRYIEEFVISRLHSIHFTVPLVETWDIVLYIEDFVK